MPEETPKPEKPAASAPAALHFETVTLDQPIVRGEQRIGEVQLRKPKAGEMRGLQLQSVVQGDVNAMITLIPRISNPPLLQQEVEAMDSDDFAALSGAVQSFFMSKSDRQMIAKLFGQDPSTS